MKKIIFLLIAMFTFSSCAMFMPTHDNRDPRRPKESNKAMKIRKQKTHDFRGNR